VSEIRIDDFKERSSNLLEAYSKIEDWMRRPTLLLKFILISSL
jgi:hypothetical protein